jgi:hypothetical protein
VQREYDVSDPAGIEFLTLAAEALDRAEALSERIQADGVVERGPTGVKSHPSLRDELANRAFVTKTLHRLGLNFEPLRLAPGRPRGRRHAD